MNGNKGLYEECALTILIFRLTKEFFGHLQFELGELRFAVTKTKVSPASG